MHYNGSKGGSGVYQKIISLMPAHTIYIETHLGGGSILLRKRPAVRSYAVEIDPDVMEAFQMEHGSVLHDMTFKQMNCIDFLRSFPWSHAMQEMVYVDPPYLPGIRRSQKRLYRHEYTEDDHIELLELLLSLPPSFVMISGYDSPLYDRLLSGWKTVEFRAQTRGGPAIEKLWMNYDPGQHLKHEYSYAGENYRDRERIKRKAARWVHRLRKIPADERNCLFSLLAREFPAELRYHSPGTAEMTVPPGFHDAGQDEGLHHHG